MLKYFGSTARSVMLVYTAAIFCSNVSVPTRTLCARFNTKRAKRKRHGLCSFLLHTHQLKNLPSHAVGMRA